MVGAITATTMTAKLFLDIHTMMNPPLFKDLTSDEEKVDQEVRPFSDAFLHTLLFRWKILGTNSRIICNLLESLNKGYDTWDTPFSELKQDPQTQIDAYCSRYGITLHSEDPAGWEWSKNPAEYTTLNEFFTRKFKPTKVPATAPASAAAVVAPATAVVTFFPSVSSMPRTLKNDSFSIENIGLPEPSLYNANPCTVHYLSPADYHCYHTPVEGEIVTCTLRLDGPYSMTVKPYVFGSINILERNRTAVVEILHQTGLRIAMVIIGGITVDSIRLSEGIHVGATVKRGQMLGAFARGGSSIAMFYSRPVALLPRLEEIRRSGMECKLKVGAGLVQLAP